MVDLLAPRDWRVTHVHPNYEVSDCGQVRNLVTGYLLKSSIGISGGKKIYFRVGLTALEGIKRIWPRVHVLTCWAFNGPPPSLKHEVAHRNGDHRDNRACNLRWATHTENVADAREHGTYSPPPLINGESHHLAALTESNVRAIRRLAEEGNSHRDIAALFQVDKATAGRVIRKQTWRHVL